MRSKKATDKRVPAIKSEVITVMKRAKGGHWFLYLTSGHGGKNQPLSSLLLPVQHGTQPPDGAFVDPALVGFAPSQKENLLLNVRRQVAQVHDLREPRLGNPPKFREQGVVGHHALLEHLLELQSQGHKAGDPRHAFRRSPPMQRLPGSRHIHGSIRFSVCSLFEFLRQQHLHSLPHRFLNNRGISPNSSRCLAFSSATSSFSKVSMSCHMRVTLPSPGLAYASSAFTGAW